MVLAGALASSAAFGFPVFCLICPVGLTFALVIALWRLAEFNELHGLSPSLRASLSRSICVASMVPQLLSARRRNDTPLMG